MHRASFRFSHLADVVLPGEERLAPQQLGEDAPDGPHVYSLGVVLAGEHDLWGAVPPSDHVLGETDGRIGGGAWVAGLGG